MSPAPEHRATRIRRPLRRGAQTAAAVLLSVVGATGTAHAVEPWPTDVSNAANPLIGTPYGQNGGGATATARLRVFVGARGRRAQGRERIDHRVRLHGRLSDRANGKAIRGATVQIAAEQSTSWTVIARVRTRSNGTFRAVLPPSGTRRYAALYWPFLISPAPIYSTRAVVRATPRIYLGIKRARRGLVRFRGRVSGAPIPAGGLFVLIQIRNRGEWVSVRTPRSNPAGRFASTYRFSRQAIGGRFRLRAKVPGRQTGWSLYSGHSAAHDVRPRR